MRRVRGAVALLLAGGLVACGGGGEGEGTPPAASESSAVTSSAPASSEAPAEAEEPTPSTAEELGEALAEVVPEMKITKVYTERSDPNNLLGRPSGYTSKIAFSDSRVRKSDAEFTDADAIERGGSIEVYPNAAGAKKRSKYIQAILDGGGILGTEYHYVSGGALVRITGNLVPSAARTYQAALGDI
jgi:hypothetical protein